MAFIKVFLTCSPKILYLQPQPSDCTKKERGDRRSRYRRLATKQRHLHYPNTVSGNTTTVATLIKMAWQIRICFQEMQESDEPAMLSEQTEVPCLYNQQEVTDVPAAGCR